jgi:alpha-beta hydrolase superfamily lysophospholipase
MDEATFQSLDGLGIFYRSWLPNSVPKALLVINHGVNSHGGQHSWTAEQFAMAGFAAYAIDMRGRGRSEGKRFSVDDVSWHVDDLHQLIGIAKAEHPGTPLFLLGHSAGGVVACCYSLEHQDELAGLVCESFAFQVPAPAILLSIVKLVSRVFPGLPVLRLKMEDFTRDRAAVRALNGDPLTKGEAQPANTVAALVRAGDRLKAEFARITLPLLIMHGTADKVTKFQGSQLFFDTAGASDKTLKLYEGHFHDLLNDIGKEEVMAEVLGWIEARLPRTEAAVSL